ncbi:MAG: hypothetical protein N2258_03950, partial [Brevinematales bacterium]|nr:hypothetical protein [Brevinematales bacterium]
MNGKSYILIFLSLLLFLYGVLLSHFLLANKLKKKSNFLFVIIFFFHSLFTLVAAFFDFHFFLFFTIGFLMLFFISLFV